MTAIPALLNHHAIRHHTNEGITICRTPTLYEGLQWTKDILYEIIDRKTVLYLSGGSLKTLYEQLAKEEKIFPGAVGLVDERYGKPFHKNSNEKMIGETGLLRYLQLRDVPFYPILQNEEKREAAADAYDEKVRSLHATFQKSVALLGIGPDGHTSSIIPNRPDFHNPWFDESHNYTFVSEFNDSKSYYHERVGMTFLGLTMLDMLIVCAFGESKKKALEMLFESGSEEEIPARFFKRPEIAPKTLIITDQAV